MAERRSIDAPAMARDHHAATARTEPLAHETQALVAAAYGLERGARWSAPRRPRPINLERRARFARFDAV